MIGIATAESAVRVARREFSSLFKVPLLQASLEEVESRADGSWLITFSHFRKRPESSTSSTSGIIRYIGGNVEKLYHVVVVDKTGKVKSIKIRE